jgi:Putative zinc-binding metallo-peptidase
VRDFETTPTEFQEILAKPIRELGLKLEGSPLEQYVQKLHRELAAKGLRKFRPLCYLTDEWGCPSGEPIIGIPFYLADPDLAQLERDRNDLEDAHEIMMYMRHEAGHAFNYAYQLYKSAEWRKLFGPFRRAYRDDYRPVPFSRNFVRHMAGWYAQKHPDEDFAETFAVWLTPRSRWRTRYLGWTALAKLEYVDRVARKVGELDPIRRRGRTDITVDEMEATVGEFYGLSRSEEIPVQELTMDADLTDIFDVSRKRRKGVRPAQEMLGQHRKSIVDKVAYWSGVQRPIIKRLVETICKRVEDLDLRVDVRREAEYLTEFTVYTTALSMNYLIRGKFIQP